MKATLFKNDKPIVTLYDIIKVEPNPKYGYFELHQKIYHHEIIFIKRYDEVDKVVTIDKGKFDTKVTREILP